MIGNQLPNNVIHPKRSYQEVTRRNRDESLNIRLPADCAKNRPNVQLISAPNTFPTDATRISSATCVG